MRGAAVLKISLLLSLVLSIAVTVIESRGGRRGGGSLGGLFGGWRKHKKPTSSVNTRRITSGSPMHTPLTNPASGKYPIGGMAPLPGGHHGGYPKQHMPSAGYNYYGSSAGAAHLPPGGAHYSTASALPTGAIYYTQPPMMSSGGGTGNFLVGMMTGHLLSRVMHGHGHHAYNQQQQQQQQGENGGNRIIIINNGYANDTGNATETEQLNATTTSTLEETTASNENLEASIGTSEEFSASSEEVKTEQTQKPAYETPPYGIICVPVLLNETDPNDANKMLQVEKTVCYPAPPPPPMTSSSSSSSGIVAAAGVECITRIISEIDPLDPSKTIETPFKDCSVASTEKPPKVAGEIGEVIATTAVPTTTTTTTTTTNTSTTTSENQASTL